MAHSHYPAQKLGALWSYRNGHGQ